MASRSIRELVEDALQQRAAAEKARRNLENVTFEVTEDEREILRHTPLTAEMREHISEHRDRICGMLIVMAGRRYTMRPKRRR